MSMHFAPQWVKPIKPTGSALAPNAQDAAPAQQLKATTAASPFPALGQPRSGSPTTAAPPNPPLSYSRVTHTAASPSYGPGEGYFNYGGDAPNGGNPSPFPFRYNREQILAIWDEEKFKERPIELVQLAENGAVLVSKNITKPVGLRELTELEKRVLSTGVHPPVATRRAPSHNPDGAAPMPRRAPQTADRDRDRDRKDMQGPAPPANAGRAGFGGFGRGEGGAFGGAKFSGAIAEGRQPGAIGGGFGGVGKRAPRREGDETMRPSAASTWRPTTRTGSVSGSGSGTFEGVLGFGGAPPNSGPAQSEAAEDRFANGKRDDDRAGWASGQRNWRAAPQEDAAMDSPAVETPSASVIATASATPLAERDAMLREQTPTPVSALNSEVPQTAQERADLGAINWLYRDPNGQEQGPFTGNQMHEWYSHSYFKDDLPVRRENETTFHLLSELKTLTGNAVQPFLSAVRPRLPPNIPIPLAALQASGVAPGGMPSPNSLNESFHRMNVQGPPQQQPYGHPNAPYPNHYGQPQYNAGPGYMGGAPQPWSPAAAQQSPARMNSAYGSIGPAPVFGGFGAAIGTPIQRPDMFSPAIGQASPWGAPAPVNPSAAWQQQPQQPQAPLHAPIPVQAQPEPESYFPQGEQAPEESAVAEPEAEPVTERAPEPEAEPEPEYEQESDDEKDEAFVDDDLDDDMAVAAVKATPNAWGTKAASPKASVAAIPATPSPASKLPPAHASLPPKPVAAVKTEPVAPVTPAPAKPASPTLEKAAMPKPAPWADKAPAATGPSLREIQETEARVASARKQALADARASASPAPPMSSVDDIPSSLSWGLPSQGGAKHTPPSSSTPPPLAWGGGADGPKKTLKQIQEEEERRKEKQAAQIRATQVATASAAKRGYADLAAHAAASPAQAAAAAAAGWTTVGASGKVALASPKPAAAVAKPVAAAPKPAVVAAPIAVPKTNGTEDPSQPSVEFIRWIKQALTGLTANVDDFIQMLLQFPVDPPAASRADYLEIISDSVYASSSTLDGRRFAQEFFTKRKADTLRNASGVRPAKAASLADVLKAQPKPQPADLGFKVVKAKKSKKA